MATDSIVIVAAKRTPIGALMGQFGDLSAPELGAAAIRAVLASSGLKAEEIDEVLFGCVLPAGLGQAPARQAALKAGLPVATPCTTVNKVCGSGMKAVMLGFDAIAAGSAKIVLAGGMESMSNAPYLVQKARQGLRFGHAEFLDHMLYDGLQNAYDGQPMGMFAERCVEKFKFSREQQDVYAAESVTRALAASNGDAFHDEITPVTVTTRKGEQVIDKDETPFKCDISKIPKLKPAFRPKDGTVTAASSASISDGAAAVILMLESEANARGIKPLARIVAYASHAMAPEDFTIAPISAVQKVCQKAGWQDKDIDLYEINEAFAAVAMAAIHELKLDRAKVNVNGGACALGHPIGATGTRILVTLLHSLAKRNLNRGVASLCIGGGEATAIAIERIS
ncbi:MAG: thiolase family protein [Gammaproteobacteria bacterium]|nr:thiolase family protein [Gammaproteobacteria bacterium]